MGVAGPELPSVVSRAWATVSAIPKSRRRTRPVRSIIRFDGLMSRWKIPASCAASSASPTWTANPVAMPTGTGSPSRASNDEPSTSSITSPCPDSPIGTRSSSPTTAGCSSRPSSIASRSNRARTNGEAFASSTFNAADRPVSTWRTA